MEILEINSKANLPRLMFSFWKNCLLNPPKDNGKDAFLYAGSLYITLTFLPSFDKKYAVAAPIIPPPITITSSMNPFFWEIYHNLIKYKNVEI